MRAKYESLPLTVLKDIAKDRGIKGVSTMKKADVVEALLASDPKTADKPQAQAAPATSPVAPSQATAPVASAPVSERVPVQESRPQYSQESRPQYVQESRPAYSQQESRSQYSQESRPQYGQQERPYQQEGRSGYGQQEGRPQYNQQDRRYNQRGGRNMNEQSGRYGRNDRGDRYGNNNYNNRQNGGYRNNNYNNYNAAAPQSAEMSAGMSYGAMGQEMSGEMNPSAMNVAPMNAGMINPAMASVNMSTGAQNPAAMGYGTMNPGAMNGMGTMNMEPEVMMTEEEKRLSLEALDSGEVASGILEIMPDGFGFIRCANYMPGDNDVYVAPSQIRRFNLKTGDIVCGTKRIKTGNEKFSALLFINEVNGYPTKAAEARPNFEDLTPVFPNSRLHLEVPGGKVAMRIVDLLSPIGKGQRGMIVSQPKAGKTTLLKQVAHSIKTNHPDVHLIVLLIDERPEEVTDIKESIEGPNAEVIYSTFDELPEHHKRVSEMVLERAKRLVEHGQDVMILLDSITRLARAYNLTVQPSGRTLSGGLDPAALHMPKRFFGAARCMREGGSLTILATALVETGSRMDDVVFEEFKGTGNMELVLNRKLSEKRIFPAIDILKTGTRRDDLLLTAEEQEAVENIRRATNSMKADEAVERILDLFARTKTNQEFVTHAKKTRFV